MGEVMPESEESYMGTLPFAKFCCEPKTSIISLFKKLIFLLPFSTLLGSLHDHGSLVAAQYSLEKRRWRQQ